MSVHPAFCNHEIIDKAPLDYVEMQSNPRNILKAWSLSMFAHELLNKDGDIKSQDDLADATLQKYLDVLEKINRGEDIKKPIIGVGIMDGIEIGIGREIIAACATLNIDKIPFYVRKAQSCDVKKLLGL